MIIDKEKRKKFINHLVNKGIPLKEATSLIDKEYFNNNNIWINDKYTVIIREIEANEEAPQMLWLSIKRNDKQPIVLNHWRELQEIKNMLVGEENEAVELYPAESRKVDSANQYHLWVLKSKDLRFPYGFTQRVISSPEEAEEFGAKQQPWEEQKS